MIAPCHGYTNFIVHWYYATQQTDGDITHTITKHHREFPWKEWSTRDIKSWNITSSGLMYSLKFRKSSGSGNSILQVGGKLSSLISAKIKTQILNTFKVPLVKTESAVQIHHTVYQNFQKWKYYHSETMTATFILWLVLSSSDLHYTNLNHECSLRLSIHPISKHSKKLSNLKIYSVVDNVYLIHLMLIWDTYKSKNWNLKA